MKGYTDLTRYLGCLGLIKPEVDLIRTILRTSSRLDNRWALTLDGECDALLAYNADKSFEPFVLGPTTQLIMIRRRGEVFDGRVFYKPFRADELVDSLIDIESTQQTIQSVAVRQAADSKPLANFYRLKKWPPTAILSQQKNYTILAVYLSRGAKTLQDLTTLSGQSEALCLNFLLILESHKLLEVDKGTAKQSMGAQSSTVEKQGFFSMLRNRLGLSKK